MQYVNGSNTYAYTYNEDGIRTSKTINGVRHDYLLDGTRIIKETVSSAGVEQYTMIYLYDETGAPVGMKYRTPSYAENVFDCFFFEKNLQGDIVAVYDSNGTEIATYVYTAWGECTMTHYSSTSNSPGLKNPFKYRGYYHDSETGWYYLNSRYYNPTWGRFISVDGYVSTGTGLLGYNMFAYCNNNPVMLVDFNGSNPGEAALQGWAATMWWLGAADTVLPIGDIIYWAGIAILSGYALWLGSEVISDVTPQSTVVVANKTETKTEVIPSGSPDDLPVFYGAQVSGGVLVYLTKAMTYKEAIAWAYATSPMKGIGTKWGIYTDLRDDALRISAALLPMMPIVEHASMVGGGSALIEDPAAPGIHAHFHLPGCIFNNKHKHFHLWYGPKGRI